MGGSVLRYFPGNFQGCEGVQWVARIWVQTMSRWGVGRCLSSSLPYTLSLLYIYFFLKEYLSLSGGKHGERKGQYKRRKPTGGVHR